MLVVKVLGQVLAVADLRDPGRGLQVQTLPPDAAEKGVRLDLDRVVGEDKVDTWMLPLRRWLAVCCCLRD